MTKFTTDSAMDAALDIVRDRTDRIIACKSYPTTYAQAISTTHYLAAANTSAGHFAANANGDSSGRKMAVGPVTGVTVSATGSINHIVLANASGTSIIHVTEASVSQVLTDGNTMTFGVFDIEIGDPT